MKLSIKLNNKEAEEYLMFKEFFKEVKDLPSSGLKFILKQHQIYSSIGGFNNPEKLKEVFNNQTESLKVMNEQAKEFKESENFSRHLEVAITDHFKRDGIPITLEGIQELLKLSDKNQELNKQIAQERLNYENRIYELNEKLTEIGAENVVLQNNYKQAHQNLSLYKELGDLADITSYKNHYENCSIINRKNERFKKER